MCLEDKKMWKNSKKYVFYSIYKNVTKHNKIYFGAFFRNATKQLNIFRQIKHSLNKLFLFFTMYSSFTCFSRKLPKILGRLEFMGQF